MLFLLETHPPQKQLCSPAAALVIVVLVLVAVLAGLMTVPSSGSIMNNSIHWLTASGNWPSNLTQVSGAVIKPNKEHHKGHLNYS